MGKLKPGKLPEINAVSNAITVLDHISKKTHDPYLLKEKIQYAVKELRKYCRFVRKFEETPIFWHEFKEIDND